MNDIEDVLKANKARIDQLEVPEEFESRLRNALNRKPVSSFKGRVKIYSAAMIVTLVVLTSNYDVIAYYSKQLLGYEQIMNGTLQQLNEHGKGQAIGKSHTFSNGVSLTLDYVMLDENQLLLFYTIADPSGHVNDHNISPVMSVKAFWGEYTHSSSQGIITNETEIKYISSFNPPLPFERDLSFRIGLFEQGKIEPGQIDFTLDRNTAMGHSLKINLNKAINVDETGIEIDSILASPTKTVIKGSLQSIFGLAKAHLSGERFRPKSLEIKLIANGHEITKQGEGMSTDHKGIKFHTDFDALPLDLKQLQIKLVSFTADHDVNGQFKLKTTQKNHQSLEILNQKIEVQDISQTNHETLITISSEESLILTKLYLMIDNVKVPLEETINDNYDKQMDGTIIHKRTLRFLGAGEDLELHVQRMTYAKNYNKVIEVPLN